MLINKTVVCRSETAMRDVLIVNDVDVNYPHYIKCVCKKPIISDIRHDFRNETFCPKCGTKILWVVKKDEKN